MMLQSLSIRLQNGIRFVLVPTPAPPWADLAAGCPLRERYGISTFHLQKYVNLGACCWPGGIWVTRTYLPDAAPTSVTVWFKRESHFRLSCVTTFIADLHVFAISTI